MNFLKNWGLELAILVILALPLIGAFQTNVETITVEHICEVPGDYCSQIYVTATDGRQFKVQGPLGNRSEVLSKLSPGGTFEIEVNGYTEINKVLG